MSSPKILNMSTYTIPEFKLDLFSNTWLLDTNTVVAFFDDTDKFHLNALSFFERREENEKFLIPVGVVVEVWGLLGSKRGGSVSRETTISRKLAFLNWLVSPGNNVDLISGDEHRFSDIMSFMASERNIDCVDVMISVLCHNINQQCDFKPNIAIVSKDWADLYKLKTNGQLLFGIYDFVDDETY